MRLHRFIAHDEPRRLTQQRTGERRNNVRIVQLGKNDVGTLCGKVSPQSGYYPEEVPSRSLVKHHHRHIARDIRQKFSVRREQTQGWLEVVTVNPLK
jgi:hypothetical protein